MDQPSLKAGATSTGFWAWTGNETRHHTCMKRATGHRSAPPANVPPRRQGN